MPSAELASQANSVAALATATSKRKKEEFATMVTECQEVRILDPIEIYILKQPSLVSSFYN